MHDSTFQLTFGGQTLVAPGDTIAGEPEFTRSPAAPDVVVPLRAVSARLYGGRGLTHSLSWQVRRQFPTIAEARAYEWARMASLPQGAQDLVITDSGITTTLTEAHLTSFQLAHLRGQAGIILESVAITGGALTTSGQVSLPAADPAPAPPTGLPAPGVWLAAGVWLDAAYWIDTAHWIDAA